MLYKKIPLKPPKSYHDLIQFVYLLHVLMIYSACVSTGNRKPIFLQLEDHTLSTNQAAQIEIQATDPDQDFVSFSFTLAPPPPTQTEGNSGQPTLQKVGAYQAVFSWTPGNADEGSYVLSLVVEDDQGGRSEESIALTVIDRGIMGGNHVRFVEPRGDAIRFDVNEGPCLEADIVLEASSLNADELFLTLGPEAPAGMMVANEGSKRYKLSWCPSQEQLSSMAQYSVSLIASNTRGLPNVVKRLLILIRSQGSNHDCVGNAPTIMYRPFDTQSGLSNVEIEAVISDDLGIKSAPTLSYQYGVAGNSWTTVVMFRDPFEEENVWVGMIPPSDLARDIQVRYYISVSDDDDLTGTLCDHLTEGEIQEFLWIWNENITPNYGLCEPCQLDLQCGDINDLCVLSLSTQGNAEGGLEGICGQACDAQNSCPVPYECIEVMTRGGMVARQCIKPRGCTEECESDRYDASRVMNNSDQNPSLIELGEHPNLSICAQDDDWYRVPVEANQDVSIALDFQHIVGDLDLEVFVEGVNPPRSYQSRSSSDGELIEFTTPCVAEVTGSLNLLIHVFGYNSAQNAYGMRITQNISSGSCMSTCSTLTDCAVGSYCSGGSCIPASCSLNGCTEGLVCLSPRAGLNPQNNEGLCALECQNELDCRVGERCTRFDDFRSYCVPSGDQRAGESCTSFRDCAEAMICFPSVNMGFCAVANCTQGSCQSGTVCADVGIGGKACVLNCIEQIDCDEYGLSCQDLNGVQGCVP